ncbi:MULTISPECIES: hypothetical protein [Bacillus]|uniref:hypothetical protein n=1 Tax=Bacillus TaxID=1386 RepID=UPI000469823F|nr:MULTISPECIES: hypothetical protein [Bacillus]MED1412901.1 hypothetical protein [Bacillus paramycoides]MED1466710.1 hypothetical protein [Bacillus paramycoides]MED1495546.1 hypothetical protein [Bacillus paramycoides]
MKTNLIKVVAAGALITSVLGACSESSNVEVKKKDSEPKQEQQSSSSPKKEEKKAESKAGSRSNPVAIGQSATFEDNIFDQATSKSYKAKVEVSIQEVLRGEQAWKLIQQENQFNKAPADDMEYVLVKVKTKVVDADTADFAYRSDDIMNTEYVSADGKVYQLDTEHHPIIPTPLQSEVFKGAEAEGYSVQYIKKNDDFKFVYKTLSMQKVYFNTK